MIHQVIWEMGKWSCYNVTCVRITLEPSHHSWSTWWEKWVLQSGKIIWENDVIRNGNVRFRVGMTWCDVDFCIGCSSIGFSRLSIRPDHIRWIIWLTIWDRKADLACWTGIIIWSGYLLSIYRSVYTDLKVSAWSVATWTILDGGRIMGRWGASHGWQGINALMTQGMGKIHLWIVVISNSFQWIFQPFVGELMLTKPPKWGENFNLKYK